MISALLQTKGKMKIVQRLDVSWILFFIYVFNIMFLNKQAHLDIDSQVAGIPINAPYIAAVIGNMSFEMLIVCERIPLVKSSYVLAILMCLVSAYFTFNIEYPPSLKSVLLFTQNQILGIKDSQHIPNSVLQLSSSLDKL